MKKLLLAALVSIVVAGAAPILLPRVDGALADNAVTEIKIDNFSFTPANATVPVGSQVRWVNRDDIPHTVASDDGLFKSKALDTDDQFTYSFTKPGTYRYFCSLHPKMTGTIVVK
ncbi:MAG TPA: cupredoxin family copper-binding protein [Candidatus Angelobacter sp.]|nr:cupredoxin family copper-binding protein [Candidatus Angelobacter sp.]